MTTNRKRPQEAKIKHHYVFRKYLMPWVENNKIWCRRGSDIFNPNPMGIGLKNHFYQSKPLTTADIKFIEDFALSSSSEYLKDLNRGWIKMFSTPQKLRRIIDSSGIDDDVIESEMTILESNLEEELHCNYENLGQPILPLLIAGDSSFLDDQKKYSDFFRYLSAQFMRTLNMKEKVISSLSGFDLAKDVNLDSVFNVMRHIFITNIAWGHIRERGEWKITFLNNLTENQFITSDQPVFNIAADNRDPKSPPQELVYYYPVSPSRAIILAKNATQNPVKHVFVNAGEANNYNLILAKKSLSQLYAKSKNDLVNISNMLSMPSGQI